MDSAGISKIMVGLGDIFPIVCNDVCSLFVQRFNVESVIVNKSSMFDIALDFHVFYFFLYCSLNLSIFSIVLYLVHFKLIVI